MDRRFGDIFQAVKSIAPYHGSYNPWLVAISVSIAILAAFVALSISSRMVNAPSWPLRWAGIEATRRIREIEAAPGPAVRPRVPIIALVAHALNDVREKCFGAGMDAFLIKPFDDRQLADMLSRWLALRTGDDAGPSKAAAGTTAPQPANPGEIDMSVLDRLRALGRPNAPSPLGRAVACFVDVAPSLARNLRDGFLNGDAEVLWRAAHSLKSSSGALGATHLAKQCAQIEALSRQSNLAAVRPLMEDLDRGVTASVERLQAIAGEVNVPA